MTDYQKAEYEVLKEVLKILSKHKLRYFAIGGTCIGAVRHKGFIPWDDDIDLAMPREDYELFRNNYYMELPVYLKKMDYDNSTHYDFLFFKIYDERTTMVDLYAKNQPDRFTGAFVDIMPVDGLPENKIRESLLINYSTFLSKLNTISRYYDLFPRKNAGLVQYIKDILKKPVGKLIKHDVCSNKILELFAKYSYDFSEKVCFTWRIGIVDCHRLEFDSRFFRETVSVEFEDVMINIPKEYDLYLKQDFGNYMELPPKEERYSGHTAYIYDLTKPCEYYAQLEREKMKK